MLIVTVISLTALSNGSTMDGGGHLNFTFQRGALSDNINLGGANCIEI